jgi:hypothetical protein
MTNVIPNPDHALRWEDRYVKNVYMDRDEAADPMENNRTGITIEDGWYG